MAVAGASLSGAGRVIAIGTRPNCVELAKEFGATDIVSYKDGDIVAQIQDLVGSVDKCILAGGKTDVVNQALMITKPNGVISNINFFDATEVFNIPCPLWGLGMSNVTFRTGFCPGGGRRIERLINMISADRVHPGKMLNVRFDGFDKIEDAFHLMDQKPRDLIKPYVMI